MSTYDEQAQRYLILIGGGPPSNYSAWSPDLPGCVATGASLEEVEREMRAAIAFHRTHDYRGLNRIRRRCRLSRRRPLWLAEIDESSGSRHGARSAPDFRSREWS